MRKTFRTTLAPLLGRRGPSLEVQLAAIREDFDAGFYLSVYRDVVESGEEPALHYIRQGWREGRDPAPLFSTDFYLERNPDVRESGLNPLYHYVKHGRRERRTTAPSGLAVAADPDLRRIADVIASEFDATFYLHSYPDVATSGLDPLVHFVTAGWHERRNPNRGFSTKYYLDNHPDVRAAGVNPFWHYLIAGRGEGRACLHPLGLRAEILERLEPIAARVNGWTRAEGPPDLLGSSEIERAISSGARAGPRHVLVALTHDDYHRNAGGAQAAIRREEAAAIAAGHGYLGLYPWQPLPCLSSDRDPILYLRLDGQELGVARASAVAEAFRRSANWSAGTSIVIHSLLGHAPEAVLEIAGALRLQTAWFWLHDYFGLCPGYNLQRNDLSYCGAPPAGSGACGICVYGPDRLDHLDRLKPLFERLAIDVVAPSQNTLTIWSRANRLPTARAQVHPHLEISFDRRPEPLPLANGPVRIAFLGATFAHKGWPDFLSVSDRLSGRDDVEFHYFGSFERIPARLFRTHVNASAADPEAMIRAVERTQIDLVVHWSTCPETFSFTTFEAFCAGALVLTNDVSGNVAAAVQQTGRGRVFRDIESLVQFLDGPELSGVVSEARLFRAKTEALVRRSALTVDLLAAVATP